MYIPLLIGFLALEPWPGSIINESTWNELPLGISESQATVILRLPPGDYRLFPDMASIENGGFDSRMNEYNRYWISDFGRIGLRVDAFGIVRGKRYTSIPVSSKIQGLKLIQFNLLLDVQP